MEPAPHGEPLKLQDSVQKRAMKIAPIITHSPVNLPQARGATPLPLRPGDIDGDENTTQALAEADGALAQQGQLSNRRDQAAVFNGMQSQAAQIQERSLQMVAHYHKGLDAASRALRRQLQGRQFKNPRQVLKEVLDKCDDHPALAHSLLQAAARQARHEGDDSEYLFFRRQLKLLWKERGKPLRGSASPAQDRKRAWATAPRKSGMGTVYRAAVTGPFNLVGLLGLVDALLAEVREHGEFETSFREIRSDMAADMAAAAASNALSKARPQIGGMTNASQVAGLLRECEHLLGRMRTKNPELRVEAIALLRHLLTLIGKFMEPEQTRTLVELIGGKHLRNQLACLNELRRILKLRVPVQLLSARNGLTSLQDNLLILSTVLTNEEQKLAQENNAQWNV